MVRSHADNGCWTIRGRVALDLVLGESFSPLLGGRLLISGAVWAFRSRRQGKGAGVSNAKIPVMMVLGASTRKMRRTSQLIRKVLSSLRKLIKLPHEFLETSV